VGGGNFCFSNKNICKPIALLLKLVLFIFPNKGKIKRLIYIY